MIYKTLTDVRQHDVTVCRMMQESMSMSDIVIQLANEKAALISEMVFRSMQLPPAIMQTPGLPHLTHTPIIHTPHIPPNTPQ